MMKLALAILVVAALTIKSGHTCSVWTAVKCATDVKAVECEVICTQNGIQSQLCRSCYGPSYDECESCVNIFGGIFQALSFSESSGQTSECGPFNWLVCNSDMVVCSDLCGPDVMTTQCAMCLGDSYGRHCASCHSQIVAPALNQTALALLGGCSPWEWLKCGAKVAECAGVCGSEGITSPGCISCFGSLYDECRGCIGLHTIIQADNSVEGCNVMEWLHCAGSLYKCLDPCIEFGVTSPQCVKCVAPAGAECFRCIPVNDREDINRVAAVQLNRQVSLTAGNGAESLLPGIVSTLASVTSAVVVVKMMLPF